MEFNCDVGLGYIGLRILDYGTTELYTGWFGGYPVLYPCPTDSSGSFSDCPTGILQHSSAAAPIYSPNLFWTGLEVFTPGATNPTNYSARTWRGYMDASIGMSGGPLTDSNGRIIGVDPT